MPKVNRELLRVEFITNLEICTEINEYFQTLLYRQDNGLLSLINGKITNKINQLQVCGCLDLLYGDSEKISENFSAVQLMIDSSQPELRAPQIDGIGG